MDLGLKGKRALVCGASKGLGRGCADALAGEGVELVIVARRATELEEAAAQIRRRFAVAVTTVACDITSEAGRAAALVPVPSPSACRGFPAPGS